MKEQIQIVATKRVTLGTGNSRDLRQKKKIPAIIYGEKKDPLPIELDEKLLRMKILDPSFFQNNVKLSMKMN